MKPKKKGDRRSSDRKFSGYPGLYRRVLQLLQVRKKLKNIDPEDLAGELERMFKEYTRYRRNPDFINAVGRASVMAVDEIKMQRNTIDLQSSSEDSSGVDLIEYEDTNAANQSLSRLYATPKHNQVETPKTEHVTSTKKEKKKKKLKDEKVDEENGPEKPDLNIYYSTKTIKDIGGCEKAILSLGEVFMAWKTPKIINKPIYQERKPSPIRGILLYGQAKCGKSLLIEVMAGEAGLPIMKINCPQIISGVTGDSENKLRQIFDQAVSHAPCVLFLKAIDTVAAKREASQRDMEKRIVAQFCACMDDLEQKGSDVKVLVVATTHSVDSVDSSLRTPGRFGREIGLGIPDPQARIAILKVLCQGLGLESDVDFQILSRNTPGYLGSDLHSLIECAANIAAERGREILTHNMLEEGTLELSQHIVDLPTSLKPLISHMRACNMAEQYPLSENTFDLLKITMADFEAALKQIQPVTMREGFFSGGDMQWDQVGALEDVKETLKRAILHPILYPNIYKLLKDKSSEGFLLYGPPGCGKTSLAKAVANEAGINFISVKGPELLNKYVGESERAVRQVFERARNSSPCVIFFDEIDSLCPRRSSSGASSARETIVNTLLAELDGMNSREYVFVIGATNRPDIVDPALLRYGRLSIRMYIGIPDDEGRVAILRALTDNGTCPRLSKEVTLEGVAYDERCAGFSGADLSNLVHAIKQKIRLGYIEKGLDSDAINTAELLATPNIIEEAFAIVDRATVSENSLQVFQNFAGTHSKKRKLSP